MIDKMKKDTPRTQSNKIFSDERIDPLLSQVQSKDAESLLGETGLAGQLKKRLAERMLEAELSHHLKQQNAQGKTQRSPQRQRREAGVPAGGCLTFGFPGTPASHFWPCVNEKRTAAFAWF